jgi:putative glutathione S-transferase
MATLSPELEAEIKGAQEQPTNDRAKKSVRLEQGEDGVFRRQRNWFGTRFGDGPGQAPVVPGRYRLLGSVGCGWARRQLIIQRLLGLSDAVPFEPFYTRAPDSWLLSRHGDVFAAFGTQRLNDFYERTDPAFQGRGTSPTILDLETGLVVTNDYHTIGIDFETAWQAHHRADAPDLYPEHLRADIDLLNQQIFDDVNNGTYKVLFAGNPSAARAALAVFQARLTDYDFRLASRRYLFGAELTDSDVRLFVTLSSYERSYRPRLAAILSEAEVPHLQDYPNLWAYARDLFANGFADELEQYYLGLLPGPSGAYIPQLGFTGDLPLGDPAEDLAAWREPSGREHLAGSARYSGPGSGGSVELWQFGALSRVAG